MTENGAEAAKLAALRYVTDTSPGISREVNGADFRYRDVDGRVVRKAEFLARIRALAIPPAWTQVWISPYSNGHIQATGRDARGRKQYRYHERWRSVRDETKYGRMVAFGRSLPALREHVNAGLALRDLSRDKVLAIIVRLLETTYIRVGNEEYARDNGSFGLTTLRNQHVTLAGTTVRFRFVGKSGKVHEVRLSDRRLARAVKRCRDLPGQLLFQYIGDDGEVTAVDSTDVNTYLREVTGEDFTAKDFRTWAGTLLAASNINTTFANDPPPSAKSALVQSIREVSTQLGNTPAVCRKGYIHPRVLSAYEDDALRELWSTCLNTARARKGLTREESALLAFLEADELERATSRP